MIGAACVDEIERWSVVFVCIADRSRKQLCCMGIGIVLVNSIGCIFSRGHFCWEAAVAVALGLGGCRF